MLGRDAKDMIEKECAEEEHAVSNGVELVDVSVVLSSLLDLGEHLEDELGVPLADFV